MVGAIGIISAIFAVLWAGLFTEDTGVFGAGVNDPQILGPFCLHQGVSNIT
jgi:hypothetical protein